MPSSSQIITEVTTSIAIVKAVHKHSNYTLLKLDNGYELKLKPYLYVKPGEVLELVPGIDSFKEVYKMISDESEGKVKRVKLHPPYCKTEIVYILPHKFLVTFRERLSSCDWESARELEQFHYRGKGFNKLVGRRTALVAECEGYGIIGFGILSATVAAAHPRFRLFSCNFTTQMKTGLINQIARIPRIVIHPEFRGMGLGVLMAKHLVDYAGEYWDITGHVPIMVEVIAAMTEYHKFFEKVGFVNLGYTGGYEKGISPQYGSGSFQARANSQNYDFIKWQKKKPYLVYPLSAPTKERIEMVYGAVSFQKKKKIMATVPKLLAPIVFDDVSVTYEIMNGLTERTTIVKEAFGVDSEHAFSAILRRFSLTIQPGDIMLITGASGSGKSTILKLLTCKGEELEKIMRIEGKITGKDLNNVARLDLACNTSLPLIDQIKQGENLKEAIELLNSVGLTEAHLYVRHPKQISDGQRYRFAIAKLCDTEKPVWIADEFASTLNPEMAAIVAKGLRKAARKSGATVILAAPHVGNFIDSLLPTNFVKLRWGAKPIVYSINVKWSCERDLTICIYNSGDLPLADIRVGGSDSLGRFDTISEYRELRPHNAITVDFPLTRLYDYSTIEIRTKEQVGEILYICEE